jgi:hypothetical protein
MLVIFTPSISQTRSPFAPYINVLNPTLKTVKRAQSSTMASAETWLRVFSNLRPFKVG